MSRAYESAQAKSYSNQNNGALIPASELDNIVEITLGFQPLGISVKHLKDGDQVAIAAYFEPAICTALIHRDDEGLHFNVSWIRGVDNGVESVRLFSGHPTFGDKDRANSVMWAPDGNIWVSRNAERTFFVLKPPEVAKGRWKLIKKVAIPGEGMVHSAILTQDGAYIATTESAIDLTSWKMCSYLLGNDETVYTNTPPRNIPDWIYGIDYRGDHHTPPHTVTDYRSPMKHGIYNLGVAEPIVPDVCGNGIAFLRDGSALVTRYGQSFPGCFNGVPGALIYIPAAMFHGK